MAARNKKILLLCVVVCLLAITLLPFIYVSYQTQKVTALFPQEQSARFVVPFDYKSLDFEESDCWGIDAPIEKAKDLNPFADYWFVGNNREIILFISKNDPNPFLSDSILKRKGYSFPELLPQNVSKIVFSEKGFQSLLSLSEDRRPLWSNCTTVCPDLTQEEIITFVELFLQNNGNIVQDVDEKVFVGVRESGHPYLWHIRLYFNSIDNVFYNSSDVLLCKTVDNQYCLSFDQHKYVYIPDEINRKIQNVFTDIDFGQNVARF